MFPTDGAEVSSPGMVIMSTPTEDRIPTISAPGINTTPRMVVDPAVAAAVAPVPVPAPAQVAAELAAAKRIPMEHHWRIKNPNIAKADAHGHLLFLCKITS